MKLSTLNYVAGAEIEELGLVQGTYVGSKHIGKDLGAGLKSIVGGELKGYTEMLQETRAAATQRMVANAEALGADAVINIRYSSAEIIEGASEVLAYGTAVKIK